MGGIFNAGERKVRPGNYYRYENNRSGGAASVIDGICAAVFAADWGPLGQVVTISADSEVEKYFGNGGNVALLNQCLLGGASKVKAVRLGTGGTKATITLKDTTATPVSTVKLTAIYPGSRALSVTIRDSLAVATLREAIIYSGTAELTKVTFAKGTGEVDALVAAINANRDSVVVAEKLAAGNGTMATVAQSAFTAGADPVITNTDYSNAFTVLESDDWNVLCVDTIDATVHALVKSFTHRAVDGGLMVMAVIAEPTSVAYATRKANAAAMNSECIVYLLNGWYDSNNAQVEGWKAAGVIAGMVAAYPSNDSLTHKAIPGAVSVVGPLTNTEVEECLNSGALVCTASSAGTIWIEQGINTLVTPAANQDAGWKKIRRVKTRFELISRILATTEPYIGTLNNDENGRATFISMANGVGNSMISEGKLMSCIVTLDDANPPAGDSAWFVISAVDLDSIEFTYNLFKFQFSA